MTSTAWSVVADANLVCYLVDASEGWIDEDTVFFKKLLALSAAPVVVVATKSDKLKAEIIDSNVQAMTQQVELCRDEVSKQLSTESADVAQARTPSLLTSAPLLISAKRPQEVQKFRDFLASQMPAGPWLFDADDLTDRPQQFVCGELIREQLFRQLGQELPYSAAVKVERFENRGRLAVIQASVIVHKDNHKAMVIGARGTRIKAIGQAARLSLEKHLDRQVHLELFVKVQANWIDSDSLLAEYAGLDKMEE
jgi:GTP-binding protein Era